MSWWAVGEPAERNCRGMSGVASLLEEFMRGVEVLEGKSVALEKNKPNPIANLLIIGQY